MQVRCIFLRVGNFFRSLAICGLLCILLPVAAAGQSYSYSDIIVEGNTRIDADSVIRISELPGSGTVSAAGLNAAFRRISDAQLFEEFAIAPRGRQLVISVVEFPTINEISIEGNERIKDEALVGLVRSQPRHVYNPALAEADATAIAEAYRVGGRFAATVTPKIIRRSGNRVDLVFEVFEGKVIETERISFVGNDVFSEGRLRRVVASKQAGIFRTFVRSDTYIAERIEADKALLEEFYTDRGYIDFEVLSVTSELTTERDAFFLVFKIREGQMYRFGDVTAATEAAGIDVEEFASHTRIVAGDVYTPKLVQETVRRMEFLAAGYDMPFIRARPEPIRDDLARIVDIRFDLVRDSKIFVERIEIEGNTTTLDRVIRRQFDIVEGDPFNPREIEEAEARINRLGFFSSVDVTTERGSTGNHVVVRVSVEEKPTGSLSFGATYAKADGVAATVNLSESNLLGRGQFLSFGIETGSSKSYSLTFVEPYFLDRRDVEFQLRTSYSSVDGGATSYSTKQWRIDPSLRFFINENTRLRVGVGLSTYKIDEVRSRSFILEEDFNRGRGDTISANYLVDFDSRRTAFNPRHGIIFRGGQDFAYGTKDKTSAITTTGLLGGQTTILNEEVTLTGELEGGILTASGGPSRIRDRFHMHGGIMRGFAANGIGPRDFTLARARDKEAPPTRTYHTALGGNYFAAMRLESRFPLGVSEELGLAGGLFLDAGSIWGLDDKRCANYGRYAVGPDQDSVIGENCLIDDRMHLRSAAGFSLFWTTLLGPLRFNFAKDLRSQPYDERQSFNLELESSF